MPAANAASVALKAAADEAEAAGAGEPAPAAGEDDEPPQAAAVSVNAVATTTRRAFRRTAGRTNQGWVRAFFVMTKRYPLAGLSN